LRVKETGNCGFTDHRSWKNDYGWSSYGDHSCVRTF
jgi:hypothetical protein